MRTMCKGDRVIYFDSRSRSEGPATIEAVHKDPQGGDFFTILLPGGKEKQTERARLRHADVAAPCRPVAYATPVANATCVPPAPPAGAQRVVVRARTVERVEAAERTRVGTVLKVHYLTKSAYEIMKEGHCDGHCFDYMVRRVSPAEVIFTASALTPCPHPPTRTCTLAVDWRVGVVTNHLGFLLLPFYSILRDVGLPDPHYSVRYLSSERTPLHAATHPHLPPPPPRNTVSSKCAR